jgi:hypothetical protein
MDRIVRHGNIQFFQETAFAAVRFAWCSAPAAPRVCDYLPRRSTAFGRKRDVRLFLGKNFSKTGLCAPAERLMSLPDKISAHIRDEESQNFSEKISLTTVGFAELVV